MTVETHSQLARFIWDICNLLRGPFKRNEYPEIILLTALMREVQDAIERLQEYRTALITAAVTGKINVRTQLKTATLSP